MAKPSRRCAWCRNEHSPNVHCLVPLLDRLLAQVGHERHKFDNDLDRAVTAACEWIQREMDDRTTFMTENHELRKLLREAHDVLDADGHAALSSRIHQALEDPRDEPRIPPDDPNDHEWKRGAFG